MCGLCLRLIVLYIFVSFVLYVFVWTLCSGLLVSCLWLLLCLCFDLLCYMCAELWVVVRDVGGCGFGGWFGSLALVGCGFAVLVCGWVLASGILFAGGCFLVWIDNA